MVEEIDRSRLNLRLRPVRPPEERLVEADEVARRKAAARIGEQFGGYDFAAVAETSDTGVPALLATDIPWIARSLDELDQFLGAVGAAGPRVRVSQDERTDPPGLLESVSEPSSRHAAPRLRSVAVAKRLADGLTITVNDIARRVPALLDMTEDLQRLMATRVQTNVYLSEADAPGFGRHWDDHDVVIIQAFGTKYWEVHAPTSLSPLKEYVGRDDAGPVVWAGVLQPGFALYIPRGWPHSVKGFSGDASAHYTVGFHRHHYVDLLESLLDPESSEWRLDDLSIQHAIGVLRAGVMPQRLPGVLSAWRALNEPFGGITMTLPGGVIFGDGGASDRLQLVGRGTAIECSEELVEPLVRLVAGDRLSMAEVTDTWGAGVVDDLTEVARLGLAELWFDGE